MAAASAIAVFGCPPSAWNQPSPALERRLRAAWDAAQRWPQASVIVSGGDAHGNSEANCMAHWLRTRGLAGGRLVLEGRARTTVENARFVAGLLVATAPPCVALVTERYHMRRSAWLLRLALAREGLEAVRVVAWAAPDGVSAGERRRVALVEWFKLGRDHVTMGGNIPRV